MSRVYDFTFQLYGETGKVVGRVSERGHGNTRATAARQAAARLRRRGYSRVGDPVRTRFVPEGER